MKHEYNIGGDAKRKTDCCRMCCCTGCMYAQMSHEVKKRGLRYHKNSTQESSDDSEDFDCIGDCIGGVEISDSDDGGYECDFCDVECFDFDCDCDCGDCDCDEGFVECLCAILCCPFQVLGDGD
jgi:hypothetical protein